MDFLQGRAVQFDFDAHNMAIIDHVSENLKRTAIAVPLRPLFENQVGLDAVINSTTTVSLKIDTGDSGSISLNPGDWKQMLANITDAKVVTTMMASLNRDVTHTSTTRLDNVKIGSREYQHVLCSLSPAPEARSTIGTAFLRRYTATFDFPNHMLYLVPRKVSNDLENLDMSGLHLIRREGKTLVYSVDEGSPAGQAGVEPGDVIDSINGKDVAQMKMKDLRQRLKANDGDKVVFEIMHRGAPKTIAMVLRKVL